MYLQSLLDLLLQAFILFLQLTVPLKFWHPFNLLCCQLFNFISQLPIAILESFILELKFSHLIEHLFCFIVLDVFQFCYGL